MKRTILYVMFVVAIVLPVAGAELTTKVDPFQALSGRVLSSDEMEGASGSLRIFGMSLFPKLHRVNRKQRARNVSRVHCDVIAQNRADSMGLRTTNQDGTFTDYNQAKVSQIYTGFPGGRASVPPKGTAGYFFTAYGNDMQHMGAYSRGSSSDTYTRYWNDSYTEYTSTRSPDYVPPGVTKQVFVPLPKYGRESLYYYQ